VTRLVELIRTKRDGGTLDPEDIRAFIAAYSRDEVPDYQVAALLMAVYFQGLDPGELSAWTDAMLRSGEVLNLDHIPGAKVDKHSTGGVGDKISLPLAPIVAACGVRVPMVSGRGLGHTGGTLDKLESIPGFRTDLTVERYVEMVADIGASLIGQTAEITPADKRMYALRDVTATVPSIPLIASSIMSKKLAEGIDALVLDVKVGTGAFMTNEADARVLAQTMVAVGERMGKRVVALLTDMNQPLGVAVGNALEVRESIDILRGAGPDDTRTLTLTLARTMLELGGVDPGGAERAIADGSALRKFREIVAAQGGDVAAIDDPTRLPTAAHTTPLVADRAGYIAAIDTRAVGIAAGHLGAGRATKDDVIDPAVGLEICVRLGDRVEGGQPLVRMHHNERGLDAATALLRAAYTIGDEVVRAGPLVIGRVG